MTSHKSEGQIGPQISEVDSANYRVISTLATSKFLKWVI